jgi:hypothetical protein
LEGRQGSIKPPGSREAPLRNNMGGKIDWRPLPIKNKSESPVLRPCCAECLVELGKRLFSLVSARNALQHETGR